MWPVFQVCRYLQNFQWYKKYFLILVLFLGSRFKRQSFNFSLEIQRKCDRYVNPKVPISDFNFQTIFDCLPIGACGYLTTIDGKTVEPNSRILMVNMRKMRLKNSGSTGSASDSAGSSGSLLSNRSSENSRQESREPFSPTKSDNPTLNNISCDDEVSEEASDDHDEDEDEDPDNDDASASSDHFNKNRNFKEER